MKSGLSRDELAQISAILQAVPAVEKAVLFGSRAMGLARAGSDVDLMLYGDELKMQDIMQVSSLLEETALPYQFDLLRSDVKHPDLLEHIKQYGKVIFEKERRHINEASLDNEANDLNKFLEYELGQVCSRLSSGKSISAKDLYEAGKYPVYGGNGLRGYADLANFEGDCAIIGRQGAFCGNVRYFSGKAYMTEHAVVVCANSANDTRFLAYLLSTMNLGRLSGQSAQPGLSVKTLAQQKIRLPSLEIQKEIASILSALDDKIANNKAINHHLEQMAQAIFKSWFVDFEPFGGEMPTDWRIVPLGELCDSISRTHPFSKDKLIFLNTGDITDGQFLHANYSDITGMPGQAKKSIQQNDILYSEIRPINRHFAYVNFDAPEDYVVSTKLMVIRANGISSRRIYHYLTSTKILQELQVEAESRSGTFPQIRFENIQKLPILLATPDIESEFSDTLETAYNAIEANNTESARLAALRDTLLPRLMSGELSVADLGGGK